MKIPKGLSEEETIDKINLVVQRISPRYTFASYDVDDIKQEAFIICYNALERYDPKVGPLKTSSLSIYPTDLKTLLEIITIKRMMNKKRR